MEEMEIRKYARLMDELNLTGLEITSDNDRVRLERSAGSRRGAERGIRARHRAAVCPG